MARVITPQDAHQIMNALVQQATGIANVTSTDLDSFISAGELVLSTGMENVFNALSIVLNRTLVAARPYNAKLKLIQSMDTGAWSNRVRKISFYSQYALPSGFFNTDLYTNLAPGFTAGENLDGNGDPQSTKSQWEQHPPMPFEMNFAGSSVWDDCITLYEEQIEAAFRSPEEFARFVSGYLTIHGNDIAQQKEAFSRMALLNKIAATYHYDSIGATSGGVINLTKAFNDRFGTAYTSAQLRSTYLKDFLAFFVATFKNVSRYMTDNTVFRHLPFAKTVGGVDYAILRHTPYSRQRVFLYAPLFTEAEAMVLPEIFRPNYLDLGKQYEEITYWQGMSDPSAINVTPAVLDLSTGEQTKPEAAIELPYVVGVIMDEDALMTNFQLERALTSGLESRKGYRNTWLHIARNILDDPSEQCVIFTMEDPSDNDGGE